MKYKRVLKKLVKLLNENEKENYNLMFSDEEGGVYQGDYICCVVILKKGNKIVFHKMVSPQQTGETFKKLKNRLSKECIVELIKDYNK